MKRRHKVNMSFLCEVCGCVYQWEMFFHNHLRTVHGISTKRSKRMKLGKKNTAYLESYYHCVCCRLSLDEIEGVSQILKMKKETIYWWFVNRNKRDRKSIKSENHCSWQQFKTGCHHQRTCWLSFCWNSWKKKEIKGGKELIKMQVWLKI